MNASPCSPRLLAESIVHSVDPFVIQFTETWGIRWYGVAYLAGFLVAWLMARWMAKRGIIPIGVKFVGDFITACILGAVVGGRVGHVLFYERGLLTTFHEAFPWWGMLDIHKGGMSSHGGMIGCFVAMAWIGARLKISFWALCDVVCFIAPPGLMFGRLANWVNGELPGRILPESMQANPPWWSVKFPEDAVRAASAETVEHVEHLSRLTYLGNAEAAAQIAQLAPARCPNQFIQAITDGPVLMLILVLVWLRPRAPGVLFGTFLMAYGVLRMLSEQFREPDHGVWTMGPFTLPMMLSLAMVAAGAILLVTTKDRKATGAIGGLLPPKGVIADPAVSQR